MMENVNLLKFIKGVEMDLSRQMEKERGKTPASFEKLATLELELLQLEQLRQVCLEDGVSDDKFFDGGLPRHLI